MTKHRLTRRQFMQASALGAGTLALPALGLTSVAAAPTREAQASVEQPEGPAIPQPTFNPIASNTTFGPLTDISMGWDGTLWGIDAQGAPHVYDPINDVFVQHGDGIDAAAQAGDLVYFFFGDQVLYITKSQQYSASTPVPIGTQWTTLPDSFKLGVVGAANYNDKGLILFNGGRFVSTDGSIPLTNLTSLANWPQTPAWKDGVIDAVYATDVGQDVVLIRSGQFISVNPVTKAVTAQPQPLNANPLFSTYLPSSWLSSGFDVMTVAGDNYSWAFKGTAGKVFQNGGVNGAPAYLPVLFPRWPTTWHPTLRHAPNGRDGNLYSIAMPAASAQNPMGYILQHDGDTWIQQPDTADHVAVGQDNTVMIASAGKLWKDTGGGNFQPVSSASNLIQVSLGNSNAVFARDTSNNIYSFNPTTGALTPNTSVGTAIHIATTNDGSLWHAKPSDANMHRYLSDADVLQPGIAVKSGIVSAVQKVAATGFGAAHCLAQDSQGNTQAYRYDSPYVFKTTSTYSASTRGPLAQGLGRVYITANQSFTNPWPQGRTFIVALDIHTGAELSRSAVRSSDTQPIHGLSTFDPLNNLVYVGTTDYFNTYDNTTAGQLLALDARDLTKVVWSYTTPAGIDGKPVVVGTTLLFGDRTGTLYRFDTRAALAQTSNPQPAWTWKPAIGSADTYRVVPPLLSDGKVITLFWNISGSGTAKQAWFASCNADDGSDPILFNKSNTLNPAVDLHDLLTQPVAGKVRSIQAGGILGSGYYFNGGDSIFTEGDVDGPTFSLPAGTRITSGLNYDAEAQTLWFGAGPVLYALDASLRPVNHTPFTFEGGQGRYITSRPVIFTDPKGTKTILTGLVDDFATSGNLYGFDPDNGNIASIETGVTLITALSEGVTNGVIYASGTIPASVGVSGFSQVFGLRVDTLSQAARDLIIESQLMQDPDPTASGSGSNDPANPIPPSVARYQTHLTVVDDGKSPQPNESVKIWADAPNTVITVDGHHYGIGPDDAQFAAVKTGPDGSVVIVSDAIDINASALRVWASFMDPFERIVVYPDHEWHGRATSSNADPKADPNKPDPSSPNLSTVHTYKGAQLFTPEEKSQGTPTNIANAIGQMNTGLNPGGNTPAALAGALQTLHASNAAAPYVAYTDLGGMHYGPTNARLKRTATITQPVGLQLTKTGDGKHTYTPLSHSDARTAIDALTGVAWDPTNPDAADATDASAVSANSAPGVPETRVIQRSENLFTDFWNWLKGAVAAIENVIVSVADDIVVGIQFVVNGIKKAFKAVIKVVDDVVNAIGSFFLQLAKLIEDLIEALSVLFHFGEIIWTHNWLKGQINAQVQKVKTALAQQGKPAVDKFVDKGEWAIANFIDQIKGKLNPNQGINHLQGMGTTTHTAMTAGLGQAGYSGAGSSQAVQGSWGLQKMKSGLSAGTGGTFNVSTTDAASATNAADERPAGMADAIGDFINGFINSLGTNGPLNQSFEQLKSDFGRLITPTSATQFFTTLLDTLLDIVKTLLVSALAVGEAFMDGVFNVLNDVIDLVMATLNETIDIPVIGWLYQRLFGSPLTILDAATLVAAIPVTLLFRITIGQYPSQALSVDEATVSSTLAWTSRKPQGVEALSKAQQAALGWFASVLFIVYGMLNGFNDAEQAGTEGAARNISRLSVGIGLVLQLVTLPTNTNDTPSSDDWAVYAFSVISALVGAFGLPEVGLGPAASQVLSLILSMISVILIVCSIGAYLNDGDQSSGAQIGFAQNIIGTLAGIVNPLKFETYASLGVTGIIVGVVDVVTGLALCGLQLAATFLPPQALPPRINRLHFPFVAFNPQPARSARQPVGVHPLRLAGETP